MAFDNIDSLITADKKQLKESGAVGRPKKKNYEKKDKRIVSYLTSNEMYDLEDIARDNDLTVSQMARKIIIDHIKNNIQNKDHFEEQRIL